MLMTDDEHTGPAVFSLRDDLGGWRRCRRKYMKVGSGGVRSVNIRPSGGSGVLERTPPVV